MVIYGKTQERAAGIKDSVTRTKKGWLGTAPMTSLEMPVGMVRRTKA